MERSPKLEKKNENTKEVSLLRKYFLPKPIKPFQDVLILFFFMCLLYIKLSLTNLFGSTIKLGMQLLFLVHTKVEQSKSQAVKSAYIIGQAVQSQADIDSKAPDFYQRCRLDQFGLYLFSKTQGAQFIGQRSAQLVLGN